MKTARGIALAALLLLAGTAPAFAQSLTTTYASGNNFAGNTFDLLPSTDMKVTSFDVHLSGAGTPVTVAIYWRRGTSNGFENSPAGWTLLGRANVVSQGDGNPTPVPVGGLRMSAGETYGVYVDLEVGRPAANLLYTDGRNTYSNADLQLSTWYGKGEPAFVSATFDPRQWNGTVYYGPPFTTCSAEGFTGAKLTLCRKVCEVSQSPSTFAGLLRVYRAAYREDPPCSY